MSEEKIKKEDYEQYWQKGGTYVLPIEIFNELFYDIEQLQQENEKLKERLDYEIQNHIMTDKNYCETISNYKNILIEFEKWLETCLENEKYCYLSPHGEDRYRYNIFKEVLDKLQELKEGKKK